LSNSNLLSYGVTSTLIHQFADISDRQVGRIVRQERQQYQVITAVGVVSAQTSGRFNHHVLDTSDFPVIGDFVGIQLTPTKDAAIIHQELPRNSLFVRQAAGTTHQVQSVAANVNVALICMSLNHDFNPHRLERYLTVCWDSGATPVVVLTKSDLCSDTEAKLAVIAPMTLGVTVLTTTTTTANGLAPLQTFLQAGQTFALLGSSGVGKSILINRLLGKTIITTDGLRNDDKGHHTTTSRELYQLSSGALMIDTPGMRALGLWGADTGLAQNFSDVADLIRHCRFRNCHHQTEPGCAVKAALATGQLTTERGQSYQKLQAENAYSHDTQAYLAQKQRTEVANAKQIRQIYHPKHY